jgi:hypothetical protein
MAELCLTATRRREVVVFNGGDCVVTIVLRKNDRGKVVDYQPYVGKIKKS